MAAAALWASSTLARANPMINVGEHLLVEDTPAQRIEIWVTGGAQVQGLNFYLQIADGGLEAGGNVDGPIIQHVNIIGADTIFAENHSGQTDSLTLPQISLQLTSTATGAVTADGLLAMVTIDTTGFFAGGVFDLKLADTHEGNTDFAGDSIDITNGLIIIVVPEPASVAILCAGLCGTVLRSRRRRGSTRPRTRRERVN